MSIKFRWAQVCTLSTVALFGCDREIEVEDPEPVPAAIACEGADAITQIWTPTRRADLDTALQQQPGEWPQQLLAILDARVGSNAQVWRRNYLRACEQGERKAQRCLDMQAWELDAIVELATTHPEHAASMWAEIDAVLRDADACDARQEPSFDAPSLSPRVGREWASLRLLLNASDYVAVDNTVRALEGDETVGQTPAYALPITASKVVVALSKGDADQANAALGQAEALAASLGPRAQMTVAQAQAFAASSRGDVPAAMVALDQSVAAARAQEDPWLLFLQLRNIGRVKVQLGDGAGAIEPLAEAISLSTRLAGAENPHTAEVQISLAQAQLGLDRVETGYDLLTQARDSFVNTLGPDHPQTVASVEAIGQLFMAAGRPGEAQYAYLDLLEIYGDLYGPKDWHTAMVKLALGDSLMAMEQHEGARTMYMEALVPLVQSLGADHRAAIQTSIHLGIAELALGNLDAAGDHCRRSVDLVKALAPGDPLIAEAKACAEQLGAAKPSKPKRPR
ncbi:tetratricopeptide repeat protein [Enhygromyxa salina]|uniref:tetratricopeptide repeat protein n=1 Tax=Enhygromyxa salina TaxID=215803 RepID=UPI0011BAB036|nr:tetratricopeptide repeat protein [Enhygromyxa salina]